MIGTHQDTAEPFGDAHEVVARLRSGVKDEKERKEATRSFWRELPILVLIALVVAVVVKSFLVQAFFIPSASMRDTLIEGDRVMVNKLSYTLGDLSRGDVVVFDAPFSDHNDGENLVAKVLRNVGEAIGMTQPASDFIKRVVALEGETIEISGNVLLIDGNPLVEDYLSPGIVMPDFGPEVIPAGHVFVMGDNRNASQDSRFFGAIPVEDVVGKAFSVVWPPSRWSGL